MTDLIPRLRALAEKHRALMGDGELSLLLDGAADSLTAQEVAIGAGLGEIERLSEIPCIVESPDGNPGWSTIGDAVKLLADARRERDHFENHINVMEEAREAVWRENQNLRAALEWIANSAGEKLERGFMGERHADCVFRAREALAK